MKAFEPIDNLTANRDISDAQLKTLLKSDEFDSLLFDAADKRRREVYGDDIDPKGRELGLKAGANVVMPNLSPVSVRKLHALYGNKICIGEEAAQCCGCLERRVLSAGYRIVTSVGNVKKQS